LFIFLQADGEGRQRSDLHGLKESIDSKSLLLNNILLERD
jgi:hypothetical protein